MGGSADFVSKSFIIVSIIVNVTANSHFHSYLVTHIVFTVSALKILADCKQLIE